MAVVVAGRGPLGFLDLGDAVQRLTLAQSRLAGSSPASAVPSAEDNLILSAPMPSPGRRGRRSRRVRVVPVVVSIRLVVRCVRRVLPVPHAPAASPATAAPSRILRIAGVIVTVAPGGQRLPSRRSQFVRPLLPTLAIVVAGVRARTGRRTRLVELAPSLLVTCPPDHPTLGVATLRG